MIRFTTNLGVIDIELDPEHAPITCANFENYVKSGFYDGTIFHRVIRGFMIQGGGFEKGMKQKPTNAPIENEAANGLKNNKYTIAMARTQDPHSATAQFFINVTMTSSTTPLPLRRAGAMPSSARLWPVRMVDQIAKVRTGMVSFYGDVPAQKICDRKGRDHLKGGECTVGRHFAPTGSRLPHTHENRHGHPESASSARTSRTYRDRPPTGRDHHLTFILPLRSPKPSWPSYAS